MTTPLSASAARLLSAAAVLALVTACPAPPPADLTPPAVPALGIPGQTDSSIQLTWTAVGDDDNTGTATTYELRSLSGSACPLTRTNFSTGTAISGLGAPKAAGSAEAFNVTGLTGDTVFCFMLRVADEEGNSAFSGSVSASTTDLVPPARAALTVSNAGDTSVRLDWLAVGDNGVSGTASAYELRYLSGASCPVNAANFASGTLVSPLPIPVAAGTPQFTTVTGLTPAADYCFALKVSDEAGNSSLSASVGATTSDTVAPAAVTLATGTATGTSIALSWTAVGDDGTTGTAASYELRSATGAACPLAAASFSSGTLVSGLPAPSAAGSSEAFTVSGLLSDKSYCFMLQVTDDSGNSSLSNSASGSTRDVTAPDAAALSVANLQGTSVQVSWLAVGDDGSTGTATSYDLRYASGAACPLTPATFGGATAVGGLPPPSAPGTPESATAMGLTSDTPYCFMLQVSDESGNSSYSNSLPARTPDVVSPAAASIGAGVVAATSVQVTWTAVGDDGTTGTASSYDLRYRSGASCPITAGNFGSSTAAAGLSAPRPSGQPESFIVQGLTSDTTYCFMLQVTDDASNTSLSNALTQATPDVTPPASASLSGAAFDTSVQLDWTAVGDDGTTGTATAQELRYLSGAACPINTGNFASGTLAPGLGAPAASGTPETLTVSGLTRQTTYCFALRVADEVGNASVSNTLTRTTPDTAAPAVVALSAGGATVRSLHVSWTAVGDDGNAGTASSYDLRYLSGAACPVTAANFASATQFAAGSPQAAGSMEDYVVSGLAPGTSYCFALQVTDDASNSSLSNSAAGSTLADTTPPGPVADLAVGTTTPTSIQLNWTAVADDGTTAATGPASSYDLRYLSGAACPIDASNFAGATAVTGLAAPAAPGTAESVTVSGLSGGVSYCFLLQVSDAAANTSFSNAANGLTGDGTPPAPVADLAVTGPDASGQLSLTWTAVGDDGNAGTATGYDLRYSTGSCTAFNFSSATPLTGLPTPGASGAAQSFNTTLSPFGQYCFGLQVSDDVGLSSLSNTAGATPDATAQMAQIRAQIHGATSSPVTLNAGVGGAIVTYLKPGVGGAPPGSVDGPGFFVQNGGTGPALFVAVDPASISGLAVSDVLDLGVTQAAWLGCAAPPCTADNSMYAITQATAALTSTGATLPAAQDLTAITVPVPIGPGPWAFEHELVSVTNGTLGAFSAGGSGFEQAQITTTGNVSPQFQLRAADSVITAKGVATGCRATVTGTPMWRSDVNAQVAAWQPSEVSLTGCPAISIPSTAPIDGTRNVPVTTTYAANINQPLTPGTLSMQAASGACAAANTVQMSADQGFTNCVGGTIAVSGLNNVITVTPAAPLAAGARYRVRLTNPAASPNGNVVAAATPAGVANGFVTDNPAAACTTRAVVISQIYGGGGNGGSVYKNDFIELHNRSSSAVDLTGWSVQYTSAAGTGTWSVTNLSGTIAPGGYYLVQEAVGAGGTVALPTPDATGTIAMGATAGKVALVNSTTALTGGCPTTATIQDLVGFGSTASCFSGAPTLTLTNPTSAQREEVGCADTGSDYADFAQVVSAPTANLPKNSASPANTCSCP